MHSQTEEGLEWLRVAEWSPSLGQMSLDPREQRNVWEHTVHWVLGAGEVRTAWCQAHHRGPWGVSRNKPNLKLETQAEAAHQNRGRWVVWKSQLP